MSLTILEKPTEDNITIIDSVNFRQCVADCVTKAAYTKEIFYITRRGRVLAKLTALDPADIEKIKKLEEMNK